MAAAEEFYCLRALCLERKDAWGGVADRLEVRVCVNADAIDAAALVVTRASGAQAEKLPCAAGAVRNPRLSASDFAIVFATELGTT